MDLALLVYGISVLGNITPVLGMTIAFSIFIFIGLTLYRFVGLNVESWDGVNTAKQKIEKRPGFEKWMKRFAGIIVVATLLTIFIPSEKTAYMMVGAYATQKIAENDKVQETGQKVLAIINQKLDHYVEEGFKEAEKKVKEKTK